MTQVEVLAMHVAIADEGAGKPADKPIAEFFPKVVLDGWQRSEEQRHAEWEARLKGMTCEKAIEEVSARGNALVIWKENGKFRAARYSREHSIFREFVPAYLRRPA